MLARMARETRTATSDIIRKYSGPGGEDMMMFDWACLVHEINREVRESDPKRRSSGDEVNRPLDPKGKEGLDDWERQRQRITGE